jgi:glycerol-3-phosphate acyltransferase PlsY
MNDLLVKTLMSYLIGSLIGSLIVGRFWGGVDIRSLGSGNAGGTNALRTQGKLFALWVMIIDVGKGWVVTRLLPNWAVPGVPLAAAPFREWVQVACGAAAIVGHVYPIWYRFRGGKGVATLVGVLLGLGARLVVPVFLVWLLMVVVAGFVGLASISAAASVPFIVILEDLEPYAPLLSFGVFAALLVALTHRANISRMRAGIEPRARKLWLFGRRSANEKAGSSS